MTFNVIEDGDDGLSVPVMENFAHVGRLAFSSFYPMNAVGAYALQNLGETGKEWGDFYMASGKKIYVGGVEFKGGGGGSSLEILEQKSHLEKSGINYPISMTDGMNESFIDSTNVVITPRVTYASGTTFIADYNKTDIDLMNATTGWTAGTNTPTVAQDTTNKIEGTGSVKMTKASLNGSIDMYKTFTAFSLVDQLLTFSFFPDTITNVTRFYVTIESSASNLKTYYVPVANITAAAWNHISIDVTNDVADASTGTLVPGGITKVYFGYTTSSSQSVNVSVDFVVYQPNWILPLPASLYIWDGTNQERIAIASVAGTANHQRRTYTITALSNGYAVGAAYAKERNVTISNNQGIFPAGLSGAVALTVYDQTVEHLPTTLAGKTLTMSQRFWDEEFKISSLPSTTSTKLSSATDKKAYFKTGDKVILYHKRFEGRKYNSRYNATAGANFIIITLTSDATHASGEITLAHTGEVNSGADTSYWYAVRYSAEMLYALEAETATGALTTLTPTVFLPKQITPKTVFSDDFNRTEDPPSTNNWVYANESGRALDANHYLKINGTALASLAYSTGSNWIYGSIKRNLEGYSLSSGKVISFDATLEGNGYGDVSWMVGLSDYSLTAGASHYVRVRATGSGSYTKTVELYVYNTLVDTYAHDTLATTRYKLFISPANVKLEIYTGATLVATRNYAIPVPINPTSVNTLYIRCYNVNGGTPCTLDNFLVETIDNGYIVRGSADNLTGSKLTTATKLTRQDTTNQNPVIYQRSAILS